MQLFAPQGIFYMKGWIKLHRQIRDNPFYKEPKAMLIWIECLLRANHEGSRTLLRRQMVRLKPGQFVMGGTEFGQSVGIGKSTVWFWLNQFAADEMLTLEKTSKGSIVSIKNWEKYQVTDTSLDANQTQIRRKADYQKNVKNEKNVEEVRGATPSQLAKEFFEDLDVQEKTITFLINKGLPENRAREEIQRFVLYWTEPNKSGTKVRWQMEKTFDVKRRLVTWISRIKNFNQSNQPKGITL